MKILILCITIWAIFMNAPAMAAEDEHGHHEKAQTESTHSESQGQGMHNETEGHDGHQEVDHQEAGHAKEGNGGHDDEGGLIKLSPAQIKQGGIRSEVIYQRAKSEAVHAPGSVTFNAYNLADVTTLVDAVVHARHVRLGAEVKQGQKLVTITSSELAQAQAGYLRAEAEHRKSKLALQRIKGLVQEKIVSQARLQQAQSTYQAAHANLAAAKASLFAYGMFKKQINGLLKSTHYGQLTLYAPSAGTIVLDDFRTGQHIAAGTRLLQIADESSVWVEVKLSQAQMHGIRAGRNAVVSTRAGKTHYKGKVINIHHQLDQTTRTVGVRLEVENPEDALHPGMFVQAEIEAGSGEEALLLPESAVQRQGNELIVFVEEEPGHFERREVEISKASMGMVAVLKGIKEGESVVVQGAFVLASELAKSGFAAHNH